MNRIQLELDPNEANLVDDALQRVLHHLRIELTHADDRAFRANVRAQLDALEDIALRLDRARAEA
jgi:hypothetical protein